ncbi:MULTISPECIES: cupin domain-containing protein [unclassified Haladaptatus]|uniref:cupin domain-containing protein n=1 Tax=unclassified Haladaptatus TaxID=2622732 RepID=UPI0023E78594|nr:MULTISPECIES: cupin domain-containing protein [unclassified Haladaptatus]
MKKVAIDEVNVVTNPMNVHSIRRPVSRALGTEEFAMNYFELETGESFSGGLHTHYDQEEVFYVQSGTATFETKIDGERDTVTVDAGEAIRFAPGEFQQGLNGEDEPVVGFAFGAPGATHDWDEIESITYCRDCEEETPHGLDLTEKGGFKMDCKECDMTFTIERSD